MLLPVVPILTSFVRLAMSSPLHTLVGPPLVIDALARRWAQARRVPLPQGLALVPLTDVLLDDIAELATSSPRIGHASIAPVPDGVALVAFEASAGGVLAWIRRDGGVVEAVVWEVGRVVLGPLSGDDAVDRALLRAGAWTRPGESVVDALGLRWATTDALAQRGTSRFEHGR